MKDLLTLVVVVGLLSGSAFAGASANVRPLGGSLGAPVGDGMWHGYRYDFAAGGPAGSSMNLYDNVPSVYGGTATPGLWGAGGTIPGTWIWMDWSQGPAQFSDDLHQITAGPGPAVVTKLWYGYLNLSDPATHVIKIYDMVPPSATYGGTTVTIDKGSLLASISLPGMPTGTYSVIVTSLSIPLSSSSVWIKFHDPTGAGASGSFWLTGGVPGIGSSNPGLLHTRKDLELNRYYGFPAGIIHDAYSATGPNIAVGLGGFHVPGPATISLLGLGGLVSLRRRRARA